MHDDERTLEMLKLISTAEHHFNNLTFNIRALASTWLLATLAGIGWILKDLKKSDVDYLIDKPDLIIALCMGSSVGIFVLWIIDIKVYQSLLNVWFDARDLYEDGKKFPKIREKMKKLFESGRATQLIKYYYVLLCSVPLLIALYVAKKVSSDPALLMLVLMLVLVNGTIYHFSPKDSDEKQDGNVSR